MRPNVIAHPELAHEGQRRIDWVRRNMPILESIGTRFEQEKPFTGLRAVVCIHLEAKTANLALTLACGGAQVAATGSNPDSTKDDVVAALAESGIAVYARHGASPEEMRDHMRMALDIEPHIVIDDGGDLVELIEDERPELLSTLMGVCEETTTGVRRAEAREAEGKLSVPVFAINDARCKFLFDNVHGTGQSVWDAIMRAGNTTIAGKVVLVVGFGWCGRGIALRADGLGARVIVAERDAVKAADAAMHGYEVAPLFDACTRADIVVTATGEAATLAADHFAVLKDGAMLANAGHFWTEIDAPALKAAAEEVVPVREMIDGYRMADGHWLYLLGDAHIVNIACGDGHPAEIMDTSFALQALTAEYLVKTRDNLEPVVHQVPEAIDAEVARGKLAAMGLRIDS
ncbi:MAG: adenosylhomocysteinase [Pseudomonadota bacterium]